MSMPFYVAPEQVMKDRAEFARKNIARGRPLVAGSFAGGILLWNPLQGLATLTYVLIVFFIIDGILIIILALQHRRDLSGRWEWMMIGGVMDLVLAAIIISGLPGTLAWALGLLVGIDLVWGGASLIAMALAARNASA